MRSKKRLGGASHAHVYGRLGFAVRLGVEHLDQIGIDGGAWYGAVNSDGNHSPFIVPMAGFFFLHAL